jgi:NAD(P)-dependent dehydrogenase (short-subunit alcohol dehydrogenase family)
MVPVTWLVTGRVTIKSAVGLLTYFPFSRANRGIGLALVRQLLQDPSNIVLATCRTPQSASLLRDLNPLSPGRLNICELDVSDPASITKSVDSANTVLADHGLDYLINNAGVVSYIGYHFYI